MLTPNKLGGVSDDAKKLYEYLKANPDDIDNYPLEVIVSFVGIDLEMWDRIGMLATKDEHEEERKSLSTRYFVNSHHLYRQTIKYDKYLKQLKYRQ